MISGAAVETNSPAKERTDGETRYRGVALCCGGSGDGGDGGETRHRRSPVVKHSQQVLIYSQHLTLETRDPIILLPSSCPTQPTPTPPSPPLHIRPQPCKIILFTSLLDVHGGAGMQYIYYLGVNIER